MSGGLQLDELIGETSNGPVRRVGNRERNGSPRSGRRRRANSLAMIAGSPEVMVKISGFGRGKGVLNTLNYVSHRTERENGVERTIELEGELRDGDTISGKEAMKELYESWRSIEERHHPRRRDTMNLVLSMPPGTNRDLVTEASRRFARETFASNHEYLLVTHRDEDHPHTHVIVRMLGDDGKRLDPRKDDLQEWRQRFADHLRDLGIDAAATPRLARGRTMKGERAVLRHIREKPKGTKIIDEVKRADALQWLSQGSEPRPWEARIVETQRSVRAKYAAAATTLMADKDQATQKVGRELRGFVERMPQPTTERHQLAAALIKELRRGDQMQDRGRDREPER
jgi:Relaxase/Mobilisation nuclease domain